MKMFGKYKAIVTKILDDKKMGRIKVKCPKVYGDSDSPYCTPCSPMFGDKIGFFTLPKVGSNVWIEFEEGDVKYPIYVGGWWTKENSPIQISYDANAKDTLIIEDASGNSIKMTPNGVIIESSSDLTLKADGDLIVESQEVHFND